MSSLLIPPRPTTVIAPPPAQAPAMVPKLQDLVLPDIRDEIVRKDSEYAAWLKDKVKVSAFVKYSYNSVADFARQVRSIPWRIAGGIGLFGASAVALTYGAALYSAGQVQYEKERQELLAAENAKRAEEARQAALRQAEETQKQAALAKARAEFQSNYASLIPEAYRATFAGEFIYVAGGTFQMGSAEGENDERVHTVTVSPFAAQVTEASQQQWVQVMGTEPWKKYDAKFWGDDKPAVGITWNEAGTFCQRIGGRLLTEAEWELIATNYGKSKWALPAGVSQISAQYANYNNGLGRTESVRSYQPNPLGFFNLSGNVWEWVGDRYGEYPTSPVVDPTGPQSGDYRVIRGGGWDYYDVRARGANRGHLSPGNYVNDVGFRCVLSPRTP